MPPAEEDHGQPEAAHKRTDIESKGTEEVLREALGDVGTWQSWICLLLSAAKIPVAWTQLGMLIMAASVTYKCTDSFQNNTCFSNNGTPCTEWVYDRSVFIETITTEWDLVCSRAQLVNLAQMILMIGIMVGNILFSIASDRFGRKKPLIFSIWMQMICGLIVAVMPWFIGFVIFRFLQAVAVGGSMTITFVICMEILNGKWRSVISILYQIPFSLGVIIMAGIGYLTRHWRYFELAVTLPVVLLLSYYWWIPESPRWLLAVGRDEEALKILQQAAVRNKNPVPAVITRIKEEKVSTEESPGFCDLLRTPNLRKKTLILWFNWGVVGFCFFGLEQYLSLVGENVFISLVIAGFLVIPASFVGIYTLENFGRRLTLGVSQVVCGLSCLAILLLPQGSPNTPTFQLLLAAFGVMAATVAFGTAYLYSTEIFPTVVRNTGLGSGSMIGRVGSMIAPFAATTSSVAWQLPPLLFGVPSILAGLLCIMLPETLNAPLPITIEDGEAFGTRASKG